MGCTPGSLYHPGQGADAAVIKYSAKGVTLWSTVYPEPGVPDVGDDWFEDIAVAGSSVYAVGRQEVDHGGLVDADFLTVRIER